MKKICRICGEEKEESEFYLNRRQCKKCLNAKTHSLENDYWENRLRTAYNYQKERFGCLTEEDDLTLDDIFELLREQWGDCVACYKPFTEDDPFTLGHKVTPKEGGHLTKSNMQLLHKACNSAQRSKAIDYIQIRDDRLKEEFEKGFEFLNQLLPYLPELLRAS